MNRLSCLPLAALFALAGCVSVKTPDKPIEINLNVNIRQEVLVRLQRDVDDLIRQNPDAFPGASAPTRTPGSTTSGTTPVTTAPPKGR